jgi:acyl-CoA thioester hydrolase
LKDFTVTIAPRFYETDALGHINNIAITAWFEVLRVRLLESLGSGSASVAKNWVLAALAMDYVDETFYGADVSMRVTDASVGNKSLTIHCEMSQGGRLTVRGKAVLVHLDLETKETRRIPQPLRELIEAL